MKTPAESLTFTIPLGEEAHHLAQEFRLRQRSKAKAKQVYLNTLAVYAVKFYLQCMEIQTDWEKSDSWNPVMQTLMDVADLNIPNHGTLECRAVLPNSEVVEIPTEWEDRIGYVAVQLDQSLREATILGFVETVAAEKLPLNQLQSIEVLLEHLSQPTQPQSIPTQKNVVQLSQWLHNVFEEGWQTVEALFNPLSSQPAISFRQLSSMRSSILKHSKDGIKRGKLLDLEKENNKVALFVGVTPTTVAELSISIEVYPTESQTYLPPELQLLVLDAQGKVVIQTQTRTKNEYIQIEFSAKSGEEISIKLVLGRDSFIETFLV